MNWNGLFEAAASVVEGAVEEAPPANRLPDWKGFWAGASVAGFAGDAPPNRVGVAAAGVEVAGGVG